MAIYRWLSHSFHMVIFHSYGTVYQRVIPPFRFIKSLVSGVMPLLRGMAHLLIKPYVHPFTPHRSYVHPMFTPYFPYVVCLRDLKTLTHWDERSKNIGWTIWMPHGLVKKTLFDQPLRTQVGFLRRHFLGHSGCATLPVPGQPGHLSRGDGVLPTLGIWRL